ncbi:hypothetical protein ATANTOWER_002105 [Ataeniobius toweri]|uniref:Uncharacterized protein n=1 Tax=Ataeniobius toweri TaxID=208326 RepID=A0ABU7B5H8_9TELE|nr:hypothetical protein [Ataeniobius toweri]
MDQPQPYVSKKVEVLTDQKFWIQERNSSLGLQEAQQMQDQDELGHQQMKEEEEEPEPVKIKNEQEEPEPAQINEKHKVLESLLKTENQEEPELFQIKTEEEKPEDLQIKDEQEEISVNLEKEKLQLKQETDPFTVNTTYKERENRKLEVNGVQLHVQVSPKSENQNQDNKNHGDPGRTHENSHSRKDFLMCKLWKRFLPKRVFIKALKDSHRSKLCSRVPCRDAVSTKTSLKEGQQEPHPMVMCSVVSGQNEPFSSHCSRG